MEKGIEIKIYETKEILKECIGRSGLNVSVMEMILRDLYLETSDLAKQNLNVKINEYNKYLASQEKEELEDGEHQSIPDGDT